ncbi:S8 family serine peptidase [Bradyrhizobium sp.]|jgi:subtilisin family serine protease|uniref:S8 family serine peptidase n=1 Tax=Bradyrhizobium sp. TaxID=376 RepID=UPI002DFD8615|nr:S8 family serine peptidase [Bradyrhizobium sp.]
MSDSSTQDPDFRNRFKSFVSRVAQSVKAGAARAVDLISSIGTTEVQGPASPAATMQTVAGSAAQTKYRVVAYGMDDGQINYATEVLSANTTRTPAFVSGDADDAAIQKLRERGLVVETLFELDSDGRAKSLRPETPGLSARPVSGRPRSTVFSTSLRVDDPVPIPDLDLSQPNVYLIHIPDPLLQEYLSALAGLGVQIMDSFRNGFYSAFLTFDQVTEVRKLGFVADVELYDRRHTSPSRATVTSTLARTAAVSHEPVKYDVVLHRPEDLEEVKTWLVAHDVTIEASGRKKIRISLPENSPMRTEIDDLTAVKRQEQYVEPRLANDLARVLLRLDAPPAMSGFPDGSGQIVAVADTGIDQQHPDFAGRIAAAIGFGPDGKTDDFHGHGTHVAGSVLGSGAASNGQYRGTAPAAKLYFQSLQRNGSPLGALPADLNDLLQPAYDAGARIHNNSWGAKAFSTYPIHSEEIDEFIHANRDMLVVVAAGNEGRADQRENTQAGIVDWLSICSLGTAKNVLTVGASRSNRTEGGKSKQSWRDFSPWYPDAPIGDETTAGDPESLAAFSSRGPSDDRRIKPDVVAPGTNIISARSASADGAIYWGDVTSNPKYAYCGGTSMAAPLVAGCAAIVRQYYMERHNHKPSAALLRATIINGARWLAGQDANQSNPEGKVPPANYDQGFGCVDMTTTIPNPANPSLALTFFDKWNSQERRLNRTGDVQRFALKVNAGATLRVCLAYTDRPARGAQNQVALLVRKSGGGEMLTGNFQLRGSLGKIDRDNNVQVVRIANAAAGIYDIQISATNLRESQDFALVVTGDLGTATLQPLG